MLSTMVTVYKRNASDHTKGIAARRAGDECRRAFRMLDCTACERRGPSDEADIAPQASTPRRALRKCKWVWVVWDEM